MVLAPLVWLGRERVEREVARARDAELQMRHHQRRLGRVLWMCLGEEGIGYLLGMLSFRVSGHTLGMMLLQSAFFVIFAAPVFTLILWRWLEEQA